MPNPKSIRKFMHWLLLVVVLLYIVSGFGITEFRVVETLTLGILTKSLAFKIHDVLWLPFVVLLVSHILSSLILRPSRKV